VAYETRARGCIPVPSAALNGPWPGECCSHRSTGSRRRPEHRYNGHPCSGLDVLGDRGYLLALLAGAIVDV
jgi:hypothetical protein